VPSEGNRLRHVSPPARLLKYATSCIAAVYPEPPPPEPLGLALINELVRDGRSFPRMLA